MTKVEREPKLAPRMREAIMELKGRIRDHYPDAAFQVTRSPENPRIIHLMTAVDVEDREAIVDLVIDRVMELQIDEGLPVHVIPVRPRERVLAMWRLTREGAQQQGSNSSPPHP